MLFVLSLTKIQAQDNRLIDPMEAGVTLLFPHFELHIPNFMPAELERIERDDYYDYTFYGDSAYANVCWPEDEDYPLGLAVKKDTIMLSEDLDNSVGDKEFVIQPKNTSDKFRLSMGSLHRTYEITDNRQKMDEPLEEPLSWSDSTPYLQLRDSALHFLEPLDTTPVSLHESIQSKYNLRDTLVIVPGEYSIIAEFTRDGKLFTTWTDYYILKIERIQTNGEVEVKYVGFWINDSC
jgi:hypothetical protein